eukprot:260522-Hanusia_phi.AAC.3
MTGVALQSRDHCHPPLDIFCTPQPPTGPTERPGRAPPGRAPGCRGNRSARGLKLIGVNLRAPMRRLRVSTTVAESCHGTPRLAGDWMKAIE